MLPREVQRNLRQEPAGLTPKVALLFAGTAILILASIAILAVSLRRPSGPGPDVPPQVATIGTAVAEVPPTAAPDTPTAAPTARPPTTTPTRAAAATAARPATATITASATSPASATPQLPMVVYGGCSMALPPGFVEESPSNGYYPAVDRTGFAALDSFDTANGQRTPEALAQGFATTILSKVIQNYRQTGAERAGDGYRIDYTATVGGKPGKGSFYIKEFGALACGATLFTLDSSGTSFATSFNIMVVSLKPAPSTRPGTATPTR